MYKSAPYPPMHCTIPTYAYIVRLTHKYSMSMLETHHVMPVHCYMSSHGARCDARRPALLARKTA